VNQHQCTIKRHGWQFVGTINKEISVTNIHHFTSNCQHVNCSKVL